MVVSALCALALVLVGFAHRPAEAAPPAADAALAAYLAAGGTLDDLCLDAGGDGGTLSHADCPACTLAKTIAPPPVAAGLAAPAPCAAARLATPDRPALAGHTPRAPPARGPPATRIA
jgi:hypothetical protein